MKEVARKTLCKAKAKAKEYMILESMRRCVLWFADALLWDLLNRRRPPIRTGNAFLFGSVIPDVPLMLLTVWYLVHRVRSDNPPSEESPFYGPEYDTYFFDNYYWILLTSLFHAPFLLLMYFLCGAVFKWLDWAIGAPIMWFTASCALNSVLDIFTHVQDGIVIFFPFDKNYRFHSWVSYYEADHGGRIFTAVEYGVDALLLLYLAFRAIHYSYSQKRLSRYIEVQQYVMDNPIV